MKAVQIDFDDGRILAKMIHFTFAHKTLEVASIGVSWSPRVDLCKHWSEKKCRNVLSMLVACGFVETYDGFTGKVAKLTDCGVRFFKISGCTT